MPQQELLGDEDSPYRGVVREGTCDLLTQRGPLQYAARLGKLPQLELLLEAGTPVDCLDPNGWTAIQVMQENIPCIEHASQEHAHTAQYDWKISFQYLCEVSVCYKRAHIMMHPACRLLDSILSSVRQKGSFCGRALRTLLQMCQCCSTEELEGRLKKRNGVTAICYTKLGGPTAGGTFLSHHAVVLCIIVMIMCAQYLCYFIMI